MALALPADVPQRALLQEITFGVVLFTLLVQGTTSAGSWLGPSDDPDRPAATSVGGTGLVGRLASAAALRRRPVRRRMPSISSRYWPADGRPVEPLEVLEVLPTDLADRPAGVAAEVEDASRRDAPVAVRPRRARPAHASRRCTRRRRTSGPTSSRVRPLPAGGVAAAVPVGASGAALPRRPAGSSCARDERRGSAAPHRLRAPGSARSASYRRRASGSPMRSHAALMADIRSAASSPATSGWYLRASRR